MADAKFWEERIAAWRASGLTQRQFCERELIPRGTLSRWSRRLRGDAAPKPAAVRIAQLVRIPTVTPPAIGSAGAALVIEVGGARVTVGHGADVATVVTVLAMVGVGGAR